MVSEEDRNIILDEESTKYVLKGYTIDEQTTTTAQLSKRLARDPLSFSLFSLYLLTSCIIGLAGWEILMPLVYFICISIPIAGFFTTLKRFIFLEIDEEGNTNTTQKIRSGR